MEASSRALPKWAKLQRFNLWLFGLMPLALLVARGGAEVFMAVIGLSFLATIAQQKKWDIVKDPLVGTLFVTWLALNILVSPFAGNVGESFGRSLLWLRFIVFFAAVPFWLVRSHDDLTLIMRAWGIILAFAIIDGLVQLATGTSLTGRPMLGNRLTAALDRPNIGIFVVRIGFPFMAGWLLLIAARVTDRDLWRVKPSMWGFACLMVAFVLLTGERSATLLTLIALAAMVLLATMISVEYRRYGLFGILAAAAALAAVLLGSARILARARSALQVIEHFWHSIYGELILAGLRLWREHPLAGVGMDNFRFACREILDRGLISECHPHPHNMYVEWLAETGMIGFLGFAVFVVILIWRVLKPLRADDAHIRLVGTFLAGCLLVVLLPFSVGQSFFSNWPAMLLWSSLALTAAVARLACGGEGR